MLRLQQYFTDSDVSRIAYFYRNYIILQYILKILDSLTKNLNYFKGKCFSCNNILPIPVLVE